MRRRAVLAVVVAAGIVPAAEAGSLDLRVGGFLPRADTGSRDPAHFDLFTDQTELYTVERSDWKGVFGGIQYNAGLARNLELGFAIDGHSRSNDTVYRDYTHSNDTDIPQTLRFTTVPTSITLRFVPGGRRARLAPFVGVGGSLIFWKYEGFGEFIDFASARQPISDDHFVSDGVTPGFHIEGGLHVPVGHDFAVVGTARYQWGTANMGDDYRFNKIDLSGLSVTVGLNLRF